MLLKIRIFCKNLTEAWIQKHERFIFYMTAEKGKGEGMGMGEDYEQSITNVTGDSRGDTRWKTLSRVAVLGAQFATVSHGPQES